MSRKEILKKYTNEDNFSEIRFSDLKEKDIRNIKSVYFGMCAEVDNNIGKIIENLKKTKNDMVCSDALIGEGFYNPDKKYKNFLSDHYYSKMKKIYSSSIYSYYLKNFQIPYSIDYEFIRRINPIITSTVMIKTSLIKKVGNFRNLPLPANLDCWRAVLQFTNFSFIDEPLTYYDNAHGDGRNYLK